MPLSADGILGFFNGTTRRCEAFEHVSLAAAGFLASSTSAAASPLRVRGTPILEPSGFDNANNSRHIAAASTIPTATVMPQSPTRSSEATGTLHICTLPEVMWCSIGVVTATSAPSQRQLAFSSEAPAFSSSRNPSFALGGPDSPGGAGTKGFLVSAVEEGRPRNGRGRGDQSPRKTDEELPELSAFGTVDDAQTPPHQAEAAHRHAASPARGLSLGAAARYHSTEDQRHHRGSVEDIISAAETVPLTQLHVRGGGDGGRGRSAGSFDEAAADGIQLPGSAASIRAQPSFSVFRSDSVIIDAEKPAQRSHDGTLRVGGEHAAVASALSPTSAAATGSGIPRVNPLSREENNSSGANAFSVNNEAPLAGSVTVLLWVATGAAPSAAMLDEGDRALTPSIQHLTTSPRPDGKSAHGLQLTAGAGGHATKKNSGFTGDIGATGAALPACLCFSVRDIVRAESGDTDVLTLRERHVQRFTVLLESGAPVYTARTTSDVFVSVQPTLASANTSASSLTVPSYGASPRMASSGEASCSFVFYQGGITRCVASLRKHSPSILYNCTGARQNSSSGAAMSITSDGFSARSGKGVVSPAPLSRTVSSHTTPRDFYTSDAQGIVVAGVANGSHTGTPQSTSPGLPWSDADANSREGGSWKQKPLSSEGVTENDQRQGGKSSGGGWRNRLSPAALFRHSKHTGPFSDPTRSPPHDTLPTSAPTTAATATVIGLTFGGAVNGDGKGTHQHHPQKANCQRGQPGSPAVGAVMHNTAGVDDAGGRSSNSSFEDLADEMTAVRLGACYVPPKPSLPPVDLTVSTNGRGLVKAAEWEKVFDFVPQTTSPTLPSTAALAHGVGAVKHGKVLNAERWRVFRQSLYERGGLVDSSVRFEVWCYLLGAFAVDSTSDERRETLAKEEELYTRLTTQWKSFLPEQEEHFAVYRYAKHSILKDVERTDRSHPAFREDDSDMLRILRELLLAHVMLNMDLGYSQGMSDVAAIASLVAPASAGAAMFLCFRKMLSEHMATNFIIEERKKDAPYAAVKGLQRKLYQVQVLTRHFHPRLYGHLKMRCMAEDMTFCFRWILVCFKRDLGSLLDTMRFWDVLFACPYTTSYEVIVTVALLVALAPQIITHIHAYETLLQFMNVLSTGISLDQMLHCAREFYENVCVIEARELRRQQRPFLKYSSSTKAQETTSEWYNGGNQTKPGIPHLHTVTPSTEAGSEHFPTVEEMVLLFLETDGPL